MSQTFEGGCSCGTVRYRLKSAPIFVHCCHCLDCQKQTGGAFAINALIETVRIEMLAGQPKPVSMPTDSGRPHDVYRCENCQVALWSDYGGRPYLACFDTGSPARDRPGRAYFHTLEGSLGWIAGASARV